MNDILTYLLPLAITGLIISAVFFTVKKNDIIKNYKQPNSHKIKNIKGLIIDSNGLLRQKVQWCNFEILINENSIFIFPRSFYVIPIRSINLIFSNSNRKFTRSPQLLREIIINKYSVDFIYYPPFLVSGKRTIRLQNLNSEEIKIFEDLKTQKNY
ncbi:hypothetical protein IX39_19400 [Chryseobacterium formosense]|uniref:Uncharacterized protein n=1 Tax=Chryseobacterium formosense TaxID=236814 RepID=A0A085YZ44_9FLAO|nr:hypothetical protein IX39_19400 [Chryseobacterium formosense]SFT76078.1 hypothetical protein SAMN05421857_3113 [Chryseobacterium formosense]